MSTFKRPRRVDPPVTTDLDPRRTLLRAGAVVAALSLTVGLAVLVPWEDRVLAGIARTLSLVIAWLGVYGVVRERSSIVELAALSLALLGFWQPVGWVVILPTGAVFAIAAAVLARWEPDEAEGEGEGVEDDGEDEEDDGEDEEDDGEDEEDDGEDEEDDGEDEEDDGEDEEDDGEDEEDDGEPAVDEGSDAGDPTEEDP
jgi:hypothetical protein